MDSPIEITRAQLEDQGKLGPLLLTIYGPTLLPENNAALQTGLPASPLEDELMAADDFYFSTIELMDCCYLAHSNNQIIAAACANPYINELHYVAVLPQYRRKGIATKLAKLCLAELERRGSDHIRLEASLSLASDGGIAFAQSLGFHEVKRTVLMARQLDGVPLPIPTDDEDDD